MEDFNDSFGSGFKSQGLYLIFYLQRKVFYHVEDINMYFWCIAEFQAPNATVSQIIAKFVASITGRLREWWINLREYKQRQVAQCNTLEDFFTIVHNEFLGSTTHYK